MRGNAPRLRQIDVARFIRGATKGAGQAPTDIFVDPHTGALRARFGTPELEEDEAANDFDRLLAAKRKKPSP